MDLILPVDERPRFHCRICGSLLLSMPSYMAHVPKCARKHESELERYRVIKRENDLVREGDPEYREWQKRTGKLI